MDEFDELLRAARICREVAHAPYSGFRVGAAVRSRSGAIFVGCNVENASFPVGLCAEAAAIAAMAATGERRIRDILVASDGEGFSPCGACRQRILEFADSETRVIVAGSAGVRAVYRCEDLLPDAFSLKRSSDSRGEAAHD